VIAPKAHFECHHRPEEEPLRATVISEVLPNDTEVVEDDTPSGVVCWKCLAFGNQSLQERCGAAVIPIVEKPLAIAQLPFPVGLRPSRRKGSRESTEKKNGSHWSKHALEQFQSEAKSRDSNNVSRCVVCHSTMFEPRPRVE
jgi:hypothetical protein